MFIKYQREVFPQPMQPIVDFANEFMQTADDKTTPTQMMVGQLAVNTLLTYMEGLPQNPNLLTNPQLSDKIVGEFASRVTQILKNEDIKSSSLQKFPTLKAFLSQE